MNLHCPTDAGSTEACSTEYVSWFASPLGSLRIGHDRHSISSLDYETSRPVGALVSVLPLAWRQALADYFAGELDALRHLPITLRQGTDFQQQVWLSLRQIPAGRTYSYRQLAQAIERPQAMRAVGQALSKNPLSIILPCHRVILQSGGLGGYAGRSDIGQMRKQFLLWHECGFGAQRISSCPPHEKIAPLKHRKAAH